MAKSEFNRTFGFFIPSKLERTDWKKTGTQLSFYWINDDQLITASKSSYPRFYSNDELPIVIKGWMFIDNNAKKMIGLVCISILGLVLSKVRMDILY